MNGPRLALALGVGLLVVLAGCAGTSSSATESPTDSPVDDGTPAGGTPTAGTPTDTPEGVSFESYVFDHAGVDRSAIEGGLRYTTGEYTTRFYATVVDSRSAAARFNHSVLDAEASAFVNGTAFASESLLVVQAFPHSSVPDYRVESVRRTDDGLAVAINDSSEGATADITVETVLLRVVDPVENVTVTTEEGRTFGTGTTTVTPEPTPTPDEVTLPYASDDPSENVDQPRSLTVRNTGNEVNGFRVRVVYHDVPDCRDASTPCGMPIRDVEVLDRRGKLRPGKSFVVEELAVRTGNYTITVTAEVPAGNGSRVTVHDSMEWTLDASSGDLAVTISDDDVLVAEADA